MPTYEVSVSDCVFKNMSTNTTDGQTDTQKDETKCTTAAFAGGN